MKKVMLIMFFALATLSLEAEAEGFNHSDSTAWNATSGRMGSDWYSNMRDVFRWRKPSGTFNCITYPCHPPRWKRGHGGMGYGGRHYGRHGYYRNFYSGFRNYRHGFHRGFRKYGQSFPKNNHRFGLDRWKTSRGSSAHVNPARRHRPDVYYPQFKTRTESVKKDPVRWDVKRATTH